MKRWTALLVGLGIAAAAGYALLSSPRPPPSTIGVASPPAHHGEIDRKTEAELLKLLRADDREGER